MATETRYIYSRHAPEPAKETDESLLDDTADPWLAEQPFGVNERIARPPRFIAATSKTGTDDSESLETASETDAAGGEGRSWYLSLERNSASGSSTPSLTSRAGKLTVPIPPDATAGPPRGKPKKSDELWFIRRALETQAREQPEASGSGSSTPTLADILTRDPPPLPSQERFKPRVWLVVGPGNKGFEMLQKNGWEEGEALGMAARRKAGLGFKQSAFSSATSAINKDVVETDEVIDLTLDSDDDDNHLLDTVASEMTTSQSQLVTSTSPDEAPGYLDHDPLALITPIPITLKSDKLGIGLKAKTVGPFRESVKKVTHSQAAMAAHARASEELRRKQRLLGRGRRGFEKIKKAEERNRKNMLAYLNAS